MSRDIIDQSRQFAMVSFPVIEAVKDARALALYVILKKFAHHRTKTAHPSRRTLAEMMGYKTTKVVDEALEVLRGLGLVETFPRFRGDNNEISYSPLPGFSQTSNGYVLRDLPEDPHPLENTPPTPIGDTPHTLEGIPPIPYRGHELDQSELDQSELEPPTDLSVGVPPTAEVVPVQAEIVPVEPQKPDKQRGQRLPDGWEPPAEVIHRMRGECPNVDLWQEHLIFSDYWRAQPGARGRKVDWIATWRNWMRRAQKDAAKASYRPAPPPTTSPKADGYRDAAERLKARMAAEGWEL